MTRPGQKNTWQRFLRAREGSALPLVGLGLMMLLASAGIAIDMSRVQAVQARMTNSLDSAGLAAGATANSADITVEATKFFNANFPSGYLGTTIESFVVSANSDNSVLTLDVSGRVSTTFMHMFGIPNVPVSAHSEITRSSRGMELVLVLDNTGSMEGSRLTSLKSASTSLINILFGDNATAENLWVGLVPFSQAVNIGSSRGSWTEADAFNWGPTSWAGCVDAREASDRDSTDDPPSVALFPKYYWPDDGNNNWISTSTDTDSNYICHNKNSCTCANYGPCTCTTSGSTTTCISCSGSGSGRDCTSTVTTVTTNYTITSSRGPNKYCPQAVTPMTSTKATILSAIDSMTTDGNTHVNLGAVWGWRMLSPRWRGLWGGQMDADLLPLDYDTPLMNKVAIIMTDGENTMSSSVRTAYWYPSNGKLGTTSSSGAVTQLNTRLSLVCERMKDEGIIVYTIAFGSPGTTIQNLMRDCASNPDFYFNSPSSAELQTAFTTIGDSLANLRISK